MTPADFIGIAYLLSLVLLCLGTFVPRASRVIFWAFRAILLILGAFFVLAFLEGSVLTVTGVLGAFEQHGLGKVFMFFFLCLYFALASFGKAFFIFLVAAGVFINCAMLRFILAVAGKFDRATIVRRIQTLRQNTWRAIFWKILNP